MRYTLFQRQPAHPANQRRRALDPLARTGEGRVISHANVMRTLAALEGQGAAGAVERALDPYGVSAAFDHRFIKRKGLTGRVLLTDAGRAYLARHRPDPAT